MTVTTAKIEHRLSERGPPHNIELEQAMLGAILVNNEAFGNVSNFLEPEHFYEPVHQVIFKVVGELVRSGKIANPMTVRSYLPAEWKDRKIGELTMSVYLARLSAEAATVILAADYGRAISDLSTRRALMAIGEELVDTACDAPADALSRDRIGEIGRRLDVISAGTRDGVTLDIRDAGDDTGRIPPRSWLLGDQFCRKFLSGLVAPGSTGKSALRYLQALALATGRPLTGQHVFRRCRVLLLSFEDDVDEIKRRLAAAMIHHKIEHSEIEGRLFYAAPKGLKLAEMRDGARQVGPLEKLLRGAIERYRPDVVILDPFVKLHSLEQNDNGAMDFVCDLLATLAIECNIAIDAPHHAKKGSLTAGDADNGRGASGIRDAARLVHTLTSMSEEEAKMFGVPTAERKAYVRLDSAKVNIARSSQEATWFTLVGVPLQNGNDEYPNGDNVQTVVPWSPPDTWADLSTAALNAALTDIDAGLKDGQRFSNSPSAKARAAWPVVQRHCTGKTEQQCREIIRTWVKNGVLYTEEYIDPVRRENVRGLRCDASKRPGRTCPTAAC